MPLSGGADKLTVGLAQIAPVWLNREQTLAKIIENVHAAAKANCNLVAFGEGLLPGYPFWIEPTGGAAFNSPMQKEIHAHYLANAVQIEAGHLNLCVKWPGSTTWQLCWALSSALRIAADIVSTPVWSTSILMAPSSRFTES
jgi:hypothetical protein